MYIQKHKKELPTWLFGLGQICFVISIILSRMENPSLAFITGLLMGFSVVVNIAYLIRWRKQRDIAKGNGGE